MRKKGNRAIYLDRLLSFYRGDLLEAVKRVILLRLGTDRTDLVSVAGLMGLNPRTLRRTLARSGCTYRVLLDGVRCQQAHEMARASHYSMSEIAFRLGFSEVSAFSRAWRRWFGDSFTASKLKFNNKALRVG